MNPEKGNLVKLFFYSNVEFAGIVEYWSEEMAILKSTTDNSVVVIRDLSDVFAYKIFIEEENEEDVQEDYEPIPLAKHTQTLQPPPMQPKFSEFEVAGVDDEDRMLTPEELIEEKARQAVRLKKMNMVNEQQSVLNNIRNPQYTSQTLPKVNYGQYPISKKPGTK